MLQEKLKSVWLEEARLVLKVEEVEKNQERVAADLEAAQEDTEMLHQQEMQHQKDYSKLKMATRTTWWAEKLGEMSIICPDSVEPAGENQRF